MTATEKQNSSAEVRLPEIGEGVTEGELVRWLVKIGDSVRPDQPIAELMTDKATVEVPSPVAGKVKALKFKEGDVIKVEQVMIDLEGGGNGTAVAAAPAKEAVTAAKAAPVAIAPVAEKAQTVSSAPGFYPPVAESRVLATPATRRLAREMGVDINVISGSGLAGRVTLEDVTQGKAGSATPAVSAKTQGIPKPAFQGIGGVSEERVAIRGIRKKIAENMQMSKHVIPHFTLMDEAVVTSLVQLREGLKEVAEKENTKITYLPFVMKALIATVRQFPMFNASIDDAALEIVYKKYFNLGFAADTPNGLMVPVIKNADQKSILELSREIIDLSKRARDGKLKPEEMKGATITITNIGTIGGNYATPIINHPEVAILGMYKIQDKVVVDGAGFKAVKTMNFTITADHRLIDGAVAANFLKQFLNRIQNPSILMIEMQ